jgi:hypothetical protein
LISSAFYIKKILCSDVFGPWSYLKNRNREHLKCQGTTLVVPKMALHMIPALAAAKLQMTEKPLGLKPNMIL